MARAITWWFIGAGACLLMLELLFRLIPVSTSTETAYYTDPLILSYPPHHRWTTSTGWDLRNAQTLQANNLGYVASRDFARDAQAVALIGDSYVEASMLAAPDRPGAQLERALGTRPVYAMGSPGTALLDYAERIRFAHEQLGVRDIVILMERGDVRQSLCGSGNVHGPCLDSKTLLPRTETLAPAGVAKRLLRQSALAQYLFSQLKFSPQRLWRQAFAPSHPSGTAVSGAVLAAPTEPNQGHARALATVDAVTQAFLERVKPHVAGRLVIVMDADRRALYAGQARADPERERFMQLARAGGVIVVDAEPLVRAHLAKSPLKLDVGPQDGHLNALGVGLIMRAAADALRSP
ncbi:hypothetical protein [Rhodoferax sp.]|uniref:hypothetical protein n=1 Tax=Rhodoferax sp. TaxID=50421 RepID=UPI002767E869|nr:hypothetical protein [Rhodoferax sp.]